MFLPQSIPRYSKMAKSTTTPATTTSTTPAPPPPLQELEQEQLRRRNTMQEACARYRQFIMPPYTNKRKTNKRMSSLLYSITELPI